MIMEEEQKICGLEISKIRKAYFSGKFQKLILDIQASGDYKNEQWMELYAYLEGLKKEDEKLDVKFARFLPQLDVIEGDDLLDELNKEGLAEAELALLDQSKAQRQACVQQTDDMLKKLYAKFNPGQNNKYAAPPSDDELMKMGFELLALDYYVAQDSIEKERIYERKITEFERKGRQRKLAENYAKTTVEYKNFKIAERRDARVKEFLNYAKKKYHQM